MRNLFANRCFEIQAGHAVSGTAAQARTLRVASGRVWVTVEGERDDFWLRAGDSVSVAPGRLVVIEADQGASRIDFLPLPCATFGLGARLRNLTGRLVDGAAKPAGAPCGSC